MTQPPTQQIPGVYHRKIGDIVVTVISDGYLDGNLEVMRNVDLDKAHKVLKDAFRPARRTSVNTFLIQSKGRSALVDTGSGDYLQKSAGKVQANLAAAGIDPDIDRHRAADAHASGPFRGAHRDAERQAVLSERRTGDARERAAALVRRRRDGEGRRTFGENVLPCRPRAGRAVQEAHAAVQGGRGLPGRHRGARSRPHAGPHRLPDRVQAASS